MIQKKLQIKKHYQKKIYEKFKLNKYLPIFEWNIIDAKTRFRFIAYSHSKTSDFWLNFLIYVIQYIRANKIINENQKITIWMNNMTPIEKLKSCWIYNADRLLEFPTMILEDCIYEIMKCSDIIRLVWCVNQDRLDNKRWMWKYDEELGRFDFDKKYIMNMRANYLSVDFLENAQNVFEQYPQFSDSKFSQYPS